MEAAFAPAPSRWGGCVNHILVAAASGSCDVLASHGEGFCASRYREARDIVILNEFHTLAAILSPG